MFIRENKFKNRLGMFDFYKGSMMLLTIFVHIGAVWGLHIGSRDVIVFIIARTASLFCGYFIISGYNFHPAKPLVCLKRQAKLFLLPYTYMLIACLAIQCLKNLFRGEGIMHGVLPYIIGFALGISENTKLYPFETSDVMTAWFLLTLFIAWNVLNTIFLIKNQKRQIFVVISIGLIGMAMTLRAPWIWCIPQGCQAVPLLYIGFIMREKKFFFHKIPLRYVVLLLIPACVSFCLGGTFMAENIYKLGLLDYIGTAAGAILLLKLYSLIEFPDTHLVGYVESVGRYAYWILCIHGVDMLAIKFNEVLEFFPQICYPWNLCVQLVWGLTFVGVGCLLLNRIKSDFYRRRTRSNKV